MVNDRLKRAGKLAGNVLISICNRLRMRQDRRSAGLVQMGHLHILLLSINILVALEVENFPLSGTHRVTRSTSSLRFMMGYVVICQNEHAYSKMRHRQ